MPKYKPCFETAYMNEIVINLHLKVSPFLGYFFISKNHNEPTKSSLYVDKIAQSGHPTSNHNNNREGGFET